MLNGVFIIDSKVKLKSVINKNSGLTDNDVKQVILDANEDLWLAPNNGISRVEISSPLSFLNEKSGLTGSINSVYRFKGVLFIGTTSGLFN